MYIGLLVTYPIILVRV